MRQDETGVCVSERGSRMVREKIGGSEEQEEKEAWKKGAAGFWPERYAAGAEKATWCCAFVGGACSVIFAVFSTTRVLSTSVPHSSLTRKANSIAWISPPLLVIGGHGGHRQQHGWLSVAQPDSLLKLVSVHVSLACKEDTKLDVTLPQARKTQNESSKQTRMHGRTSDPLRWACPRRPTQVVHPLTPARCRFQKK